ncbi:MAG: hypothetical protein V4667_00205 [Bacteroidota bacterium]
MKLLQATFFIVLTTSLFVACKKAGTGGNASISAFPEHHEDPIKNGVVYIKYNATDLPGTEPSDFDAQANVEGDHAHFHALKKGKYYLYHIGYDSAYKSIVTGGVAIVIKTESEQIISIPVAE